MVAPLHAVVLAAGEGKRLGGRHPKVLTPLWGRPSVLWPLEAVASLGPERTVVIAGAGNEDALRALVAGRAGTSVAVQHDPQGTGHAVLSAAPELKGASGDVIVLYGDGPLVTPELLSALVEQHRASGADQTIVTVELDDPTGYGRVLRGEDGSVRAIVEEKDCDDAQRLVTEVNAGIVMFDVSDGLQRLARVGKDNAQGEIYLTDLVGITVAGGGRVEALLWDEPEDVLGFNDQRELALVRALLRERILLDHMAAGVEIVDPGTTFVDVTVSLAKGVRLLPCTVIEGHVRVGPGCEVGPFARLRDGTVLESDVKVGNFVETKKSTLGRGVKAGHLTYLGDTRIGPGTNVGAGTITANYDGRDKHPTIIGAGAFIGSGTVLVAPTTVGDGARTGAGAIVTRGTTLPDGSTWVGVPARPLGAGTTASGSGGEGAS